MKKLSEYKDEEALDLLADIVEPVAAIVQDETVKRAFKGANRMPRVVRAIIKTHKKEVLEVLARLEGVPVEEYHCNIFTLPGKVIEILNDGELLGFFSTAAGETANGSSSPAMEITVETENE